MKNFDTRVYSVSDFLEWEGNGLLNLSPDFHRRSVWKEKAKSYLVDTLLRGKPIPKIIITQELKGKPGQGEVQFAGVFGLSASDCRPSVQREG